MKYLILAGLLLTSVLGGYTYLNQGGIGGEGTINQLQQWKFDGTYLTQSVTDRVLKLTGYESAGDCLVTDASGVVSTASCGTGGSGSNWTIISGGLRTSTTTDFARAAYFVATSTTATSTFAGAVGIGTTTPASKLTVVGDVNIQGTATSTAVITLRDPIGNVSFEVRAGTSTLLNTFVGVGAGSSNTTGTYNVANGYLSLYSNTTGTENTAIGHNSLNFNTTGSYNTAVGRNSIYANTTGSYNTAVGRNSIYANTTGNNNTANGLNALYSNTTGNNNTANGMNALYSNTTGTDNNANGYMSMRFNTTGSENTANGVNALYSNTTGSDNTAIGRNAGRYLTNGTSAASTTDYSLFLGYNTKALTADDQNAIVIGYNANGLGSNTVVLGNDSIVTTALKGNVGIGTTTPQGKLDVVTNTNGGNITYLTNTNTGTGAYNELNLRNAGHASDDGLRLLNLGTAWTTVGAFVQDSGMINAGGNLSGGLSVVSQAGDTRFYTGGFATGNERMRITSSGLVGIGTTTPSFPLTVANSAYIGGSLTLLSALKDSTGATGTAGMVLQSTGTSTIWVATSSLGISGGGGGGGGALSTTTDIIGVPTDTPQEVSYVTGDVMFGGNSSTSAEFQLDDDGAQLIISSTTNNNATATLESGNNAQAVRIGDDSGVGIENIFSTAGKIITRFYGSITEWIMDLAKVAITGKLYVATTTYNGATTSDALVIDGFTNSGEWMEEFCTSAGSETSQITADTSKGCGRYSYIEDVNGVLDFDVPNSATSSYFRLRAGATGGTNVAGDGMGIGWYQGLLLAYAHKNLPTMEWTMRQNTMANATSTFVFGGMTNAVGTAANFAAEPTVGFYVIATSTANWQFACNPFSGSTVYVDTGIASSTTATALANPFVHFRLEVSGTSSTAVTAILKARTDTNQNMTQVGSCTLDLSGAAGFIAPTVALGKSTAGSSPELHVNFIKFWYKQPVF